VALHRDKWRSFAYRKAVAALKAHPRPINSAAEVRGVGKGIAEKVRLASLSS
jgi:DNA polymerase/3'-5' exonuclease PolX